MEKVESPRAGGGGGTFDVRGELRGTPSSKLPVEPASEVRAVIGGFVLERPSSLVEMMTSRSDRGSLAFGDVTSCCEMLEERRESSSRSGVLL